MDRADLSEFLHRIKINKTQIVDLSNKGIEEIPEEIGELTWIKSLDLSYNNISELPPGFCNLVNLERLLILRNKISRLPVGFGSLSKLKMLDISYNPLVKLPREIGTLNNLELLDAGFCELRTLPVELTHLLGLKHLNLDENPLQFPPQKVIKRGLYAIMHFLTIEKRKNEASRVMIQVFNMPEKIQGSFRHYIKYFNQMVTKANNKEVIFDINFVNQDFYQEMELNAGVETYLFDVIRYIQEKIELIKSSGSNESLPQLYFESRMSEMKEQLFRFSSSLDDKIDEIRQMKRELKGLYDFLDSNSTPE